MVLKLESEKKREKKLKRKLLRDIRDGKVEVCSLLTIP